MHTGLKRNYFSICKFWICSNSCPELETDFLRWKLPWQMDEINFQIIISTDSINSKVLAIRPKTLFLRWQWNPKIVTHTKFESIWTKGWWVKAQKFQFLLFAKKKQHTCLLTRKWASPGYWNIFPFLRKNVFQHHFCTLSQSPLIFNLHLWLVGSLQSFPA